MADPDDPAYLRGILQHRVDSITAALGKVLRDEVREILEEFLADAERELAAFDADLK